MAKNQDGSKSALSKVLPVVGVAAMFGGVFALMWNFGGYSSIGAFEYLASERDTVLFFGFQKGESSRDDQVEALLRDARTGEPIASASWPNDARTLAASAQYIWVSAGGGLALFDAKTLEERLSVSAILDQNPFLARFVSISPVVAKDHGWPDRFDPATGRLLVTSGQNTFVLRPDGKAIPLAEAEPMSDTGRIERPKDGPCGLRQLSYWRICGDPKACVTLSEPDDYGKASLVFHGVDAKASAEPAAYVEPLPVYSGRRPICADHLDADGSVLVRYKNSPQDASPSMLAMVRPDGTQAWSVPNESFGKNADVDLVVRDGDDVRVYGSVRSPTAPLTGDYGFIATLDLATGGELSRVEFQK